jgi:drug/metabolite transporter (DMT)-like permease
VASALLFAFSNVALRMAPSAGSINVAFIRSVVFAALLSPLLPVRDLSAGAMRPMHKKAAFALFTLTTIITAVAWFAGLQALPFATATSLFSLKAAFAMIGAAVLLGERLSTRRLVALALGFIGAAILLRPDRPSLAGAAWVLGAAASSALGGIFYAQLVRIETPTRVLVASSLLQLLVLAPVSLLATVDLPLPTLLLGGTSAALSIGVMYTLAWAYRGADVGLVGLLEYLRLPFAALLAYAFFAEQPGVAFYIGSALIVVGMVCAKPLAVNKER